MMAGVKRTTKAPSTRSTPKSTRAASPAPRKSSAPAQRSQFVKQTTPKPATPAKKSVQRTISPTKPTATTKPTAVAPTATKPTAATPAKPTTAATTARPASTPTKPTATLASAPATTLVSAPATTTAATPQTKQTTGTPAATATPKTTTAVTPTATAAPGTPAAAPKQEATATAPKQDAAAAPKPDEAPKPAGGGLFGNALGALGFGGNKEAPATDKPAAPGEAPKKESSLFGNLLGGAKDTIVNSALDTMGLGDFKDIGLADRMSKLTPEQRTNLMDLAGSLKQQDQGGAPPIDLKAHLGKLTTEEKGKLFDLAASGKLKTLMGELPRLQKAAEASKPNQQELQALQNISAMLGRDKLGGADATFNYADRDAIANGLMRDRGGLRQQVLGQLNSEGKRFQARVANRALNGQRGLFTRRANQQINQQVPAEIKGQLNRGLSEAQVDPQTARFRDNAPRNISFNEMKQFEQSTNAIKGMQDRLGKALGQQVIFPNGISQEAINHTINGALDPQADARNIDRVLHSIIHNGRVELPLPPGGVLVPYR